MKSLQNGQVQVPGIQQQAQGLPTANGQPQAFRNPANPTAAPTSQAQISQAAAQVRVANGLQNGAIGGALAGLTPQQIHALQQSGRLNAQASAANIAQLAHMQQQRAFQLQQAQLQQAQQNPSLAAAHLSPTAAQQHHQQQQLLAALQRQQALSVNGVNGVSATSNTSNGNGMMGQLTNSQQQALLSLQQQIHNQHPHLPLEQVRALAQERFKAHIRNHVTQTALNAAAGNAATGVQNQALAQQHLGLHGHHNNAQMMAAFAAAQNSIGTVSSPSNSAAVLAAQNMVTSNGLGAKGLNGTGVVHSPTQMYRNMNMHATQQARLSGSPAMVPARPDSRAGTPNGMVRSASGASASPTLGSGLGR
jgi:hypothetical protein